MEEETLQGGGGTFITAHINRLEEETLHGGRGTSITAHINRLEEETLHGGGVNITSVCHCSHMEVPVVISVKHASVKMSR